jgi:hypothetical protein
MTIVNQVNCVLASLLVLILVFLRKEHDYRIDIENRSPYSLEAIFLNINGGTSLSLEAGGTSRLLTFRPPAFTLSQPQLVVYVRTLRDSLGSYIEPCEFAVPVRSLFEQAPNRVVIEASPDPYEAKRVHFRMEGVGNLSI